MDDEKIITFSKPIKFGEESYTSITLREPNAGELERATSKGEGITLIINLISMIAAVPRPVAERISARQLKEAAKFIQGFTSDGLETGLTQ